MSLREKLMQDAIDEKIALDRAEMERHFSDIIWEETHGVKESRGNGEWVECDDAMPCAADEYLVKGYGMANGVRKDFLVALEPEFSVENYYSEHSKGSRWEPEDFYEDYDIVAEWPEYWLLKEGGYDEVHCTHWMQIPDDWDGEEVM